MMSSLSRAGISSIASSRWNVIVMAPPNGEVADLSENLRARIRARAKKTGAGECRRQFEDTLPEFFLNRFQSVASEG